MCYIFSTLAYLETKIESNHLRNIEIKTSEFRQSYFILFILRKLSQKF